MFLYIDPGTGSMLFTIVLGLISAVVFLFRKVMVKLSFMLGGKAVRAKADENTYKFVIFSDSKRYWNVFKPICDEFERRGIAIEYWTASPDDPALSEKYQHVHCAFIGEGNSAFSKLNMMKADTCLSTTPGLDVYQWKRSRSVKRYVHITHDVCSITAYRMFGVDYYDSILLPGRQLVPELREIEHLRNLPEKEVEIVGSTYMDSLKKKLDSSKRPVNKNPVVLVAPSWGVSSILNRFGESFLDSLIATGYKIVLRPHPQMATSDPQLLERLKSRYPDNERFVWNHDNDNFNALNEADIMISDFSGVIFDFTLVFGKPLIYADTKLDLAPYDEAWMENPSWRMKVLPEIGRQLEEKDFGNLKTIIDEMLSDNEYKAHIKQVRDQAWEHEGEAAKLVVDYLVKGEGD